MSNIVYGVKDNARERVQNESDKNRSADRLLQEASGNDAGGARRGLRSIIRLRITAGSTELLFLPFAEDLV